MFHTRIFILRNVIRLFSSAIVSKTCNVRLKYISGKEAQSFASLLLPPFLDIEFGGSNNLDLSKLNFDWDFFYGYVGARVKDMILEVRSQRASLTQTVKEFLLCFN